MANAQKVGQRMSLLRRCAGFESVGSAAVENWTQVRKSYSARQPLLNLNNAAVSPPPFVVEQAVIDAYRFFIEVGVGLALLVGFRTRPFALLLAVYTLGTAVIGHHYWSMSGMMRLENMINFYKNVSIIGGLALLAVSGPGRYSIDRE